MVDEEEKKWRREIKVSKKIEEGEKEKKTRI